MRDGLYITDFHAHLRGNSDLCNFCAEDQEAEFFKNTVHTFERIANLSEPIHDWVLRHVGTSYRGAVSRYIYANLGQIFLMEALRLFKNYDVQQLLRSMDRNGIDHAVVMALEPFIKTRDILEAIRPHSDRISVFCSIGRNQPDPVEYFEQFIREGEIAGLKIHPVVGGYACGELYDRCKDYVALAVEERLPILIHTGHIPSSAVAGLANGCNDVRAVEPLIAAFPRGRFILAHIGWESWRYVLGMAERYPQVMVETSWQPTRVIRRAVDCIGPERVLFGSDFPLFRQSSAFDLLKKALTPREFVKVASTNARHLLRREEYKKSA